VIFKRYTIFHGGISFFNDFCVHYDSQFGRNGPTGTSDYKGFTRWVRYFDTDDNTDLSKVPQAAPPVPHNLMIHDNTVINRILYDLRISVTPVSAYITIPTSGGVQITGVINNLKLSGGVILPSIIGGKDAVVIGNFAFVNKTPMCQISIPASVTNIGSNALIMAQNVNFSGPFY